jgi:uncharacterized protein YcfL
MKTMAVCVIAAMTMVLGGCAKQSTDPRVNVADSVGSDSLGSNIILRPVGQAFSALIGEGIEVQETTVRRTPQGFKEIQVRGYNRSHSIRRFDYLVEWLDADGMVMPSKTAVWQPMSVQPKSTFTIRSIAPRVEAIDFRMNTRSQPK